MKKYKAINKRNDRQFIVTVMEDKAITFDVEKEKEKEVSLATVKRWFDLQEEIVEQPVEVIEEVVEEVVEAEVVEVVEEAKEEKPAKKKSSKKKDSSTNRKNHARTGTKKDGSERTDKFKAKVNEDDVREIRRRAASGERGIYSQLAREFGCSPSNIRYIVLRKMWKDVV